MSLLEPCCISVRGRQLIATDHFDSISFNTRKFAEQNGLEPAFDKRKVTFTVVHSEDANAFVLPGNHVFCK